MVSFPAIFLHRVPIPIGLNTDFLPKGFNLHDLNALRTFAFGKAATDLRSSTDNTLNSFKTNILLVPAVTLIL